MIVDKTLKFIKYPQAAQSIRVSEESVHSLWLQKARKFGKSYFSGLIKWVTGEMHLCVIIIEYQLSAT